MFHEIEIIGNLGKDPELRYTPEGKAVCTFSVAASNKKDETLWARVTVWNKPAESCAEYLHKGSKVLVKGALKPDENGNPHTFQRKDGTMGASFEVTADSVRFLDSKPSEEIPY